ncbi:MAG: TlyA family RNA methyltransferase [Acidobacteriota bacterium]
MTKRERADKLMMSRGLAESRQKAQALIMAGQVFAGEQKLEKPGQLVGVEKELTVRAGIPYVSRGGFKLAEALDAFAFSVAGKVAADLGSSTGGFTDCLLQRGARRVFAVDVSISQLDWRLRNDPRVTTIEKNARDLRRDHFAEPPWVVTMDLSFISVLKVLPAVRGFLDDGILLSLLKPQFEAGRGRVGKNGVLRDPVQHEEVLNRLLEGAAELRFRVRGLIRCSLRGQRGNREFFVFWTLTEPGLAPPQVRELVRKVVYEEKN